jgi:peptidoglycan/LPS O-acetylase OafA/YrhL
VLNTAPLQWIGLVSYSAYVWQQLFLASPSESGSSALAQVIHFPLLFPAVVVVSYFLVEKKTNRLGRRISQRRVRASSMVAA